MLLDFKTLCKAVSGIPMCTYCSAEGFDSVTTDSRHVGQNALFIPLRGTQQDGHRYIAQALKNGAVCVMADTEYLDTKEHTRLLDSLCKKHGATCIRVEHTLKALQYAAMTYIDQFPKLLKIGITGSNGKTTTKELLASIFAQQYSTTKNEGNFNSETGLPLSVFNVRKEHSVGIFELGMNRKGEIAELARVLKPKIAVITNIGTAHIGMLGSKDAIAEEKKHIFSCFDEESVGFIPEQDEYSTFLKEIPRGKVITYSAAHTPYTLNGLLGSTIQYKDTSIHLPLPGVHNVHNACAAIAVSQYCGISPHAIKAGIEAVPSVFGRSQIVKGPVTYLLDCYNANPDSMRAAMELCAAVNVENRKIYVLGSMKELGHASKEAHRAVCDEAFAGDADMLFFFGGEICEAAYACEKSRKKPFFCFTETQAAALCTELDAVLQRNDFVLLKGSRSLELEQFEPVLRKERP